MTVTRRVRIVASMTFVTVVLYQWGHLDGREGKASGFIGESIAAESSPTISPVKARARDFYTPTAKTLRPTKCA